MIEAPLAFTIPEAVATSRLSRTEIYRAIKRGDLTAKKNGRRTLILRDDLHALLANLPSLQAAA